MNEQIENQKAEIETPFDLSEWVPVAMPCKGGVARISWQFAGNSALDDSFYYQTMERLESEYPDHPRRETDLSFLLDYVASADSLKPDAFVFHMGRCGSTVLSNAFRAIEGALSLGEPEFVTGALLPYNGHCWPYPPDKWDAVKGDLFRSAVSFLGQQRLGAERRYFIKFTEWNVLVMKFVRSLYPDVPFIYMYREPYAVMTSFLNAPPHRLLMRALPAELFGMDREEALTLRWEEYCARLVGCFCPAAIDSLDDRTILLNYSQLGRGALLSLFSRLGIDRSEIDREKLEASLQKYSKDARPERTFVSDSAAKRRALSDLAREMVARYVEPGYAALEQIRTAREGESQ